MNEIMFPGLGFTFNVDPVLVSFGNVKIYWYGFLIVLAFIVSLFLLKKFSKKFEISFDDILEIFVLIIPVSIISARIYYILFNLDYYIKNPNEILNLTSGGLAIYGGIIGAVIAIFVYSKIKKIKFLRVLDLLVLVLPLGQAIGRWGNFFNIEAYGSQTNSIFRMRIVENNEFIDVHPTFLYESICCLIIFIILQILKNKYDEKNKYDGKLVYMYLFLYGLIRAVIEYLRQDSLMLGNIKVSFILSIILAFVFGGLLIYKSLKNLKRKNNQENN